MKKYYLLAAMLFCGLFTQAQTIEVSGLQSGTWEANTVLVTGDVSVRDSLRILPGTTVLFQDFYSISVEKGGSLRAIGTETDSILFTVADTTGFHVFNMGHGGWNGFYFNRAGQVRFDYCRLQYGKAALDDDQDGGALCIKECDDIEIGNSTLYCNFSREHGGALNAEWSKVVIHDCNVNNNLTYTELDTVYFMYGGGLRFINCEVDITDTDFSYNYGSGAIGGALSIDSCSVNIDRCRFEHNYGINGGGLYLIRSNDYACRISNSLFANNISEHFGGGLAISDSSPEMNNLTITNNLSIGVTCGGIFFYQHSNPIVRNCIVYGNFNDAPLEEPVQIWAWTYDNYAPDFYNCLIQYGLENISGNEAIQVYENCLDEDPRFFDSGNENFHLTENSPCIDAGLTKADDFDCLDLDGNPRVWDNVIDLGAYEYSAIGIDELVQNERQIRIVGNPITASSYAEIELDEACHLSASIYSVDGKLLTNEQLGIAQQGINRIKIGEQMAPLPSGSYVLLIQAGRRTFATKVIR